MLFAIINLIIGGTLAFFGLLISNPESMTPGLDLFSNSSLPPELIHMMGMIMSMIGVMMVIIGLFNLTKALLMGPRYGYSFSFGSSSKSSSSSSSSNNSYDYDDDDEEDEEIEEEDEPESEKDDGDIDEKLDDIHESIDELSKKLDKINPSNEYCCTACGRTFIVDDNFSGFIPECPSCGNTLFVNKVDKTTT